jgi:hypothetical protein
MSGIITAGVIGGVASIAGGIFGSKAAKKEKRRAEAEKRTICPPSQTHRLVKKKTVPTSPVP